MTDPTPTPQTPEASPNQSPQSTSGRCFRGALISSGLAFAMYSLTQSIVHVLAGVPLPTKSVFAANIAVAVRTLVIGVSTMATVIFTVVTLGLLALGLQLLFRQKGQQN